MQYYLLTSAANTPQDNVPNRIFLKLSISIPIHNMKNLIESNDTTNSKRKQFDREIIVALNEFLKAIGYEEEPNKLTYKPSL